MYKKLAGLMLAALMLFSFCVPAAATDHAIQPRWTYLDKVNCTLSISPGGLATATAVAKTANSDVTKLELVVSLQQLKGSTWTQIKSWSAAQNGQQCSMQNLSWTVNSGYEYQLVVTCKAYSGTKLLENANCTESYGYFE